MFTYPHANTPLGQSEGAYFLSYFMTFSLPSILEAIFESGSQGKSGSVIPPPSMILGNKPLMPYQFDLQCRSINNTHKQLLNSDWMKKECSSPVKLRANGRKKSQHCCANDVGSCCVRVGSGMQTYATTTNNVGTCSASWEGYNP